MFQQAAGLNEPTCLEKGYAFKFYPHVQAFLFCFLTRSSFSCGAALLYVGLFCCQEAFVAAAVLIYICLLVAGSVLILRCGCVDICGFVPSGGQLWGLPSISWPHPGGKGGEGWVRWITTRREGEGGEIDATN